VRVIDYLASRCRLVADAASGKYFEHVPCAPPPLHRKMEHVLSQKVLKVSHQLQYMYNQVLDTL